MRSTTAQHQSGIGSATVDLNYGAVFDRFQKNALSEQKVLLRSSMPEANAMGIADDGKTLGVAAYEFHDLFRARLTRPGVECADLFQQQTK